MLMSKWDACFRESSLFHFPLCCFSAEAAMLLWHRLLLLGELKAWDCVVTSGRFSSEESGFYFHLNPQNVGSHWFSISAILFAIPSSSLFKPGWLSFVSNIHKVFYFLREWSNSFRVSYKQSFFHCCVPQFLFIFPVLWAPISKLHLLHLLFSSPPSLSLRDSEFSTFCVRIPSAPVTTSLPHLYICSSLPLLSPFSTPQLSYSKMCPSWASSFQLFFCM